MILWQGITFGPVHSRRLGHSLGINVLPARRKACNFDCIYCECGLNDQSHGRERMPSPEEFTAVLGETLASLRARNQPIDHITFAGNGEPTLHPRFLDIVRATVALRAEHYPEAQIAVLSDAVQIDRPEVAAALELIEKPIMKIDAGSEEMFRLIDRPTVPVTLAEIVERIAGLRQRVIIQTLFLRGMAEGARVDNTTERELALLVGHYRRIDPLQVMVYTFDRQPPFPTLDKIPPAELLRLQRYLRGAGIPADAFVTASDKFTEAS